MLKTVPMSILFYLFAANIRHVQIFSSVLCLNKIIIQSKRHKYTPFVSILLNLIVQCDVWGSRQRFMKYNKHMIKLLISAQITTKLKPMYSSEGRAIFCLSILKHCIIYFFSSGLHQYILSP